MNSPDNQLAPRAQPPTLGWSLAVLGIALVAIWPALALWGFARTGWEGVAAAATALAICGFAAGISLLIVFIAQQLRQPITGVLAGMLVRVAPPLVALVVIPQMDGPIVRGGVQGMIFGYYLWALVVETWLSVKLVGSPNVGAGRAA